jgi:hypothetical protein
VTEVEFLDKSLTAHISFLSDVSRNMKTGRKWPGLVIKLSTMVKPGTGDQDLLSDNNAHASQCKQQLF